VIAFNNVSLAFGGQRIFNGLNASVSPGEKVALCGRNGSGKTTLFKLLTGDLKPDSGTIDVPGNWRIGLLSQELPLYKDHTIREEVWSSQKDLVALQNELKDLEYALSGGEASAHCIDQAVHHMAEVRERLDYLEVDKISGKMDRILAGLGFSSQDLSRSPKSFSGGWRMRIELAKLLLCAPDVLLLDEPNNHLDILALSWLESFLSRYEGTVMVISHDLFFLDRVGKRIIEIDRGKIYDYKGSYSAFLAYRKERKEAESREYEAQQRLIRQKELLIDRFRYKASKAAFAQSLITELNRMDKLEQPEGEAATLKLHFEMARPSGRTVLEVTDLSKSFGDKLVLQNVHLTLERGMKWCFVGANGNGKSTLVKLICGELAPTQGAAKLGHEVRIGYYAQEDHSALDLKLTPVQLLESECRAEMRSQVRHILGALGLREDHADKQIGVMSGGERARVRLALMLVQEHNFIILDEPTHHLDMPSKDQLKQALKKYPGTAIIVSHDRDFLMGLANKTLFFGQGYVKLYEGDINYFLDQHDGAMPGSMGRLEENRGDDFARSAPLPEKTDRKKLQRRIQNLEKQIYELERLLVQSENEMQRPEFYEREDHVLKLQTYAEDKLKYSEILQEWEGLVDSLK
jgi:ATP-binding cassette subfamily F protein 3